MRTMITIAALAAGIVTAAAATPTTTMHHRHMAKGYDGAAAVRALNEKSLQQANAGQPMAGQSMPGQPMPGQPMNGQTMSDSGAMAPANGAMAAPAAAPMSGTGDTTAPTTPQ